MNLCTNFNCRIVVWHKHGNKYAVNNPKSLCTVCSNKVQMKSNFQTLHPWYPHKPQLIALLWGRHPARVSIIWIILFMCHHVSLLVWPRIWLHTECQCISLNEYGTQKRKKKTCNILTQQEGLPSCHPQNGMTWWQLKQIASWFTYSLLVIFHGKLFSCRNVCAVVNHTWFVAVYSSCYFMVIHPTVGNPSVGCVSKSHHPFTLLLGHLAAGTYLKPGSRTTFWWHVCHEN
jgi:hypothetical protein